MEKKQYTDFNFLQISEYFALLLLFVIPPCFTGTQQNQVLEIKAFTIVIQIGLSLLIILRTAPFTQKNKAQNKAFIIIRSLITLALLYIFEQIFNHIALKFSQFSQKIPEIKHNMLFFIHLITAATYEELLYRHYLPVMAKQFLKNRYIKIIVEIIIILLFALAHRYAGIFAVLYASIAGILFRFLVIKNQEILSAIVIHFVYNSTVYFLYLFQNAA